MQERRIALVGAMPMEVEPYLTRIGDARREECGPFAFHLGTACGVPVAVLCCGIGKVNAAMAVQALIDRLAPGLVLHSGVGGSLTAGLRLLDALIARDCVQYDVDTTALGDPPGMISTIDRISLPCDAAVADGLMAAAKEAGANAKFGRVATGDRFLSSAEEKRGIAEAFGALTCDQESAAIAQVCFVHNVPCGVVRAVSDATDGAHGDEFKVYAPRAAEIAAGIVWRFLEKFGNNLQ